MSKPITSFHSHPTMGQEYQKFDVENGLKIDNPGGDWLKNKINYVENSGDNWKGSVTGTYSDDNKNVKFIKLPTKYLMTVPGRENEHLRVFPNDPRVQTLAKDIKENGLKQAPFMMVNHKGEPSMYEGNHRVRAQHVLGEEYTPVEIRYLNGGENVFHPLDKIKEYEESKMNKQAKIEIKIKEYKNADDSNFVSQKPGAPTARTTKLISAPVKWLRKLPGLRGEHEVLHPKMEKVNNLVPLVKEKSWQREHPIELEVHHNGQIYIADGNHRALACDIAHVDTYLCKITYYGGSEKDVDLEKTFSKYAGVLNIMNLRNIIQSAKEKIGLGQSISDVTSSLNKIADGNDPGATDVMGNPTSQDYNSMRESGALYNSYKDSDAGKEQRFGPEDSDDEDEAPNDMVQEASSNKPCSKCGNPTDICICIKFNETNYNKQNKPLQNEKHDLAGKVDSRMDPTKSHTAEEIKVIENIKKIAKLTKNASHIEEIEIPFSDINLENGINIRMSGRSTEEFVEQAIYRYLKTYVYKSDNRSFTIVRIEQTSNKLFVKILVYDNQLEHVEASNVASGDKLRKVSNVENKKLSKTAWRRRLTVPLGSEEESVWVKCPIQGMNLTNACGTCPLAGNPHTYAKDGYVECNYDNMTSWLGQGNNAEEHVPFQR